MDTTYLTKEQLEALKMTRGGERSKAFYESTTQLVDFETGEIKEERQTTIKKTSGEPDFIKLYYKTMLAFNGVEDIPLSFILSLAEHMTWSNNSSPLLFFNGRMIREQICTTCGIKEAMYKRYITRCRDSGILFPTPYRGTYEVNPWLIAKGKWESIRGLRTSFDFVRGKWERVTESDPDSAPTQPESTPQEKPAVPKGSSKTGLEAFPDDLPGQMSISDYMEDQTRAAEA